MLTDSLAKGVLGSPAPNLKLSHSSSSKHVTHSTVSFIILSVSLVLVGSLAKGVSGLPANSSTPLLHVHTDCYIH